MRRIKSSAKNSYFRDGINPDLCGELNKVEARALRKQKDQRKLVEQIVHVRFQNTKS